MQPVSGNNIVYILSYDFSSARRHHDELSQDCSIFNSPLCHCLQAGKWKIERHNLYVLQSGRIAAQRLADSGVVHSWRSGHGDSSRYYHPLPFCDLWEQYGMLNLSIFPRRPASAHFLHFSSILAVQALEAEQRQSDQVSVAGYAAWNLLII
jgi:hypothetical protein